MAQPKKLLASFSFSNRYLNEKFILAAVFILQWLLFRAYFIREISWGYPIGYDQTVYLGQYYSASVELLNRGIFNYLVKPWAGGYSHVPNGILLQYEAALSSLVFGASRLNALTVSFIHYIFLQILFYISIKKISKDTAFSMLGLGLLLTLGTPFLIYGGIFDFRLDFVAFCLFGSFTASVVISNAFENRRWSIVSGILGGLVILSRFNTSIYITLIYLIFFSFTILICLYNKNRIQSNKVEIIRIKNMLLSATSNLAISCVPFIFSMKAIIQYYYPGIDTKAGYTFYSAERGVTSIYTNILYYLNIFYNQTNIAIFFTVFLLVSLVIIGFIKKDYSNRASPPLKHNSAFLLIAFAVPLLILFYIKSSNECVISIVNVPFLFLLLFPLLIIYSRIQGQAKVLCKIMFVIVLISGVLLQTNAYSRRGLHANNRTNTLQVTGLYQQIADLCQLYSINSPKILVDSVKEYFMPGILKELFFEKYGYLIEPKMLLAANRDFQDKQAALKEVDNCDFAILTYASSPHEVIYPVTNTINSIRRHLNKRVNDDLIYVSGRVIEKRSVDLFIKPQLSINGLSHGWITSDGLIIEVLPKHFKGNTVVVLSGSYNPNWLTQENLSIAGKVLNHGRPEKILKSKLNLEGNRYTIKLFLPESYGPLHPQNPLTIRIDFSGYFIPSQLGINNDNRKLVFSGPSKKYIEYEKPGVH